MENKFEEFKREYLNSQKEELARLIDDKYVPKDDVLKMLNDVKNSFMVKSSEDKIILKISFI